VVKNAATTKWITQVVDPAAARAGIFKACFIGPGNNFGLGNSAMMMNEGLPLYVVKKIEEKYNLKELKVGILGAAFKGESDDIRSSLSYKLKKILEFKSKGVLMADPYVIVDGSLASFERTIAESDILIIGAPHKVYKDIVTSKPVIDIWNLLGNGNQIK
jgi:UDP-N-acetyl-D-mannosaminuronic acid dehydrogenase